MYIDIFNTSYELAFWWLNRKTHVVGTLRNDTNGIVKREIHGMRELYPEKHAVIVVLVNKNRITRTISPSHQTFAKQKTLAVLEYNAWKCNYMTTNQIVNIRYMKFVAAKL